MYTVAFIIMEHLFSPCTRFLDLLEYEDQLEEEFRGRPELLRELNADVSTNEFLDAERGFTYSDLHALLGDEYTVLWLTPHAAKRMRVQICRRL
jgi:hypothetical protein